MLDNPMKIHFTKNPAQDGVVLIFILDSVTKGINLYAHKISDDSYNKVYKFESEYTIKDFDVVVYNKVAFIFASNHKNQLVIQAIGLKDYAIVKDLDITQLIPKLPVWKSLNSIQCREYRISYKSEFNFDCVL